MKTILAILLLAGTVGQSEVELGEQRMQTHRLYWAKTRACAAGLEQARATCARVLDAGARGQCRARAGEDLLNCNEAACTWRNRELTRLREPRRREAGYC